MAVELSAIEQQVADDRRTAAQERTVDADLRLATSLCELARAFIATKSNGSDRDRAPAALEPAQEAVLIRLRHLVGGRVTAQFAGQVQEALRLFEEAARTIGHRELATATIRKACDAYRHVARQYPAAAAVCADGLSKCGVWLIRLDPDTAVAASEEAVRIRAGLFAANPDQAARYLSSLNLLLRTLMIGRQRKQALATYRERYAAWTSPAMTTRLRDTRIEEIDFTSKTQTALAKLDCQTLERAGYLTQQQILYQTDGDLTTIEEINWKLGLIGLKPLAAGALADPPSKPVEISASFGALTVLCSEPDAVGLVRAAVLEAYADAGAYPVGSTAFLGVHKSHWGMPDPELNTAMELGDDVVLVERTGGNWIAVKSLFWELTPLGRHPLALRLSQQWPVLAVNSTENLAYELCWYEDGFASNYAALGRPAGQSALDRPLAPIDFAALAEYGADYASETQVRAAFGNTAMFAKLTHLPGSGIRQESQSRPLSDSGENVLFFRQNSRPTRSRRTTVDEPAQAG
ncbi:hypothetical protein [Nocardia sp. BMG111209]|uniref:hypothetical protein n=1 Tax=Nocardia sp. BMG111209 TaxID=1160137 RepID=UPI000372D478|nr:hypothetical protein [Nocardia sp. BMG111209]